MNLIIQVIITIAALLSSAALIYIAWSGHRRDQKIKLSSIYSTLVQQLNAINSAIGQYGIGGPYATLLNIPKNQYQEFGYYTTTFFHYLRLLSTVYQNGINQKLLLPQDIDRFTSLTKMEFKPWVDSNAYLSKLRDKVLVQEELYGSSFLKWVEDLLK
jgi:hypothetical protein